MITGTMPDRGAPLRWYDIGKLDGRNGDDFEPPKTLGRACYKAYKEGYSEGKTEQ